MTEHIKPAQLSWDQHNAPESREFGDIYFSRENGLEETRYVFLEQNRLAQRFANLHPNQTFIVGETGFGTGLNFLATWQLWHTQKKVRAQASSLEFISIEKHPLSHRDFIRAHQAFPELGFFSEQLEQAYPLAQPGVHRIHFEQDNITLTLIYADAKDALKQISPLANFDEHRRKHEIAFGDKPFFVDAWFLDGFAPSKNPEMWNDTLFSSLALLSQPGTTLSTFTAAAVVRNGLTDAGFGCEKIAGFGRKRNQIIATYLNEPIAPAEQPAKPIPNKTRPSKTKDKKHVATHSEPSWHLKKTIALDAQKKSAMRSQNVAIIGGGLAGCHSAFALAKQGFNVTIYETEGQLANCASGNLQGLVYTKPSPETNPLCQFNAHAQWFANRFYQQHNFFNSCGGHTGVLHLAETEKDRRHYQQLAHQYSAFSNQLRWVDPDETEIASGLALSHGGLLIENAGWLSPQRLCRSLTLQPTIQCELNTTVTSLEHADSRWTLTLQNQNTTTEVRHDIVIVANASAATHFEHTNTLPLKAIRGQVSHFEATEQTRKLKVALCGHGYIAPAEAGLHCAGATFTLHNHSPELTDEEHQQNQNNLLAISEQLKFAGPLSDSPGRVGFRATTPDYFPMIGPVAQHTQMMETFAQLRKNGRKIPAYTGNFYPNLYCNIGHGSKGLAYTPLAAELLTSLITNKPLPLSNPLYQHVSPARFVIRDLIRNKV